MAIITKLQQYFEPNKWVKISNNVSEEIQSSRSTIENYARHKGVNVEIRPISKDMKDVYVSVEDKLRGKEVADIVKPNKDESFVRTVYRAIGDAVENLQGGKVAKAKTSASISEAQPVKNAISAGRDEFNELPKEKQIGKLAMAKYRREHHMPSPEGMTLADRYAQYLESIKNIVKNISNL